MRVPTVTFETKCYEKDWRFVLERDRLTKMITYHNYPFSERILYINNVKNISRVTERAKQLVGEGILTSYVVVEEYAADALRHFQIEKDSFLGGYYYSISELVSLFRARTDYVLHMSGDSMLAEPLNWITPAISKFEKNEVLKVANPTWNFRYDEARQESHGEDEEFFYGYGFSDQCYLVRTRDFQQTIYSETHPMSERYPAYGGELFEKRVDAWMRNHAFQRITYKHGSFIHQNFA
jgi:hypothetical protein